MEDKKVFNKICVFCGKEYTSESRGQRYCSQDCCDKANVKNKKIKKKRAQKNKERKENEVESRLASRAYSMAHFVDETYNLPKCTCSLCQGQEANNELHHFDMNIMNNDPNNLVNLCNKAHKIIHNYLPDINTIKVLAKARQSENILNAYNQLIEESWVQFLSDRGFEGTKEQYLEWLKANLQTLLSNY